MSTAPFSPSLPLYQSVFKSLRINMPEPLLNCFYALFTQGVPADVLFSVLFPSSDLNSSVQSANGSMNHDNVVNHDNIVNQGNAVNQIGQQGQIQSAQGNSVQSNGAVLTSPREKNKRLVGKNVVGSVLGESNAQRVALKSNLPDISALKALSASLAQTRTIADNVAYGSAVYTENSAANDSIAGLLEQTKKINAKLQQPMRVTARTNK